LTTHKHTHKQTNKQTNKHYSINITGLGLRPSPKPLRWVSGRSDSPSDAYRQSDSPSDAHRPWLSIFTRNLIFWNIGQLWHHF